MQLFTLPKDDPDAEAILLASEEELRQGEELTRLFLEALFKEQQSALLEDIPGQYERAREKQRERERRPVLVSYEI